MPLPSPTALPSPIPSILPAPLPTAVPTQHPSEAPTPLPTPPPTPLPTPVLRGYKDCVCVSARVVKQLAVHCPGVAQHFAEDSCLHNMTPSDLAEITVGCEAFNYAIFS
jgi:hypothetical protein